jgi:hypothetical protein
MWAQLRTGAVQGVCWSRTNLNAGDVTICEALNELAASDIGSGPPKIRKPRCNAPGALFAFVPR